MSFLLQNACKENDRALHNARKLWAQGSLEEATAARMLS
jgi:hypothetical protein